MFSEGDRVIVTCGRDDVAAMFAPVMRGDIGEVVYHDPNDNVVKLKLYRPRRNSCAPLVSCGTWFVRADGLSKIERSRG